MVPKLYAFNLYASKLYASNLFELQICYEQ